jgi:transposase
MTGADSSVWGLPEKARRVLQAAAVEAYGKPGVYVVSDRVVQRAGIVNTEEFRTISSVKRYVKVVEESCSLVPQKAPGKRKKIDERGMRLLEEDLKSRPAAKLKVRVEFLFWVLGVRVSEATVCRMIRCLGYTRKKDRWVPARGTSG